MIIYSVGLGRWFSGWCKHKDLSLESQNPRKKHSAVEGAVLKQAELWNSCWLSSLGEPMSCRFSEQSCLRK